MKRTVLVLLAAAAACASQQRPQGETYSTTSPSAEQQATVIQPSSLSPEQVRLVQRSLADRGFAVDLTGRFDDPTRQALTQFQRARGLPATGNLTPPTVDALGLDPRDVMPVRGERTDREAAPNPRDPNPEGSLRKNVPPSGSSSGAGTNTGGPTAPTDTQTQTQPQTPSQRWTR